MGGVVTGGGKVDVEDCADAFYVQPALVEMPSHAGPVLRETFAPILWVVRHSTLDEAIVMHNSVPQGLVVLDLHQRPARGRTLRLGRGLRLRHRQRQYRPVRRRDRRSLRGREGDRRRPRGRLRFLEGLHAAGDQHHQLRHRAAAGAGSQLRHRLRPLPARPSAAGGVAVARRAAAGAAVAEARSAPPGAVPAPSGIANLWTRTAGSVDGRPAATIPAHVRLSVAPVPKCSSIVANDYLSWRRLTRPGDAPTALPIRMPAIAVRLFRCMILSDQRPSGSCSVRSRTEQPCRTPRRRRRSARSSPPRA